MSDVPARNTFEAAYAGQAPWDIGRPQKATPSSMPSAAPATTPSSFAQRGHQVTGIDFLEEPITRARC
jgi:hypothetical protein